jgi:hypothetical protein
VGRGRAGPASVREVRPRRFHAPRRNPLLLVDARRWNIGAGRRRVRRLSGRRRPFHPFHARPPNPPPLVDARRWNIPTATACPGLGLHAARCQRDARLQSERTPMIVARFFMLSPGSLPRSSREIVDWFRPVSAPSWRWVSPASRRPSRTMWPIIRRPRATVASLGGRSRSQLDGMGSLKLTALRSRSTGASLARSSHQSTALDIPPTRIAGGRGLRRGSPARRPTGGPAAPRRPSGPSASITLDIPPTRIAGGG